MGDSFTQELKLSDLLNDNAIYLSHITAYHSKIAVTSVFKEKEEFVNEEIARIKEEFLQPVIMKGIGGTLVFNEINFSLFSMRAYKWLSSGNDYLLSAIMEGAKQEFFQGRPISGPITKEQFNHSILEHLKHGVGMLQYERFLKTELSNIVPQKQHLQNKTNQNKKSRISLPQKLTRKLQQEIDSICPFCGNKDVDHFQVHHIDENPSNNELDNLLMLCPTCHSKITKGDISRNAVENKKIELKNKVAGAYISILDFTSKESFGKGLKLILENKQSVFYQEIKISWNHYSLRDDTPFLKEIVHDKLAKSIEFGLLSKLSDFAQKHLNYDQAQKLIYNEIHIYTQDNSEDGYDFPIYPIIRFLGILYATSIYEKSDIHTISRNYGNMQTIFSTMIESFVKNMHVKKENENLEYPSNYHWLTGEILGMISNWLDVFNEPENFVLSSSYVDYFVSNAHFCLSELYKGVDSVKISIRFLASQIYYNFLNKYFSHNLNPALSSKIEDEIISDIPDQFIEPIFNFALDEAFAMRFDELAVMQSHTLDQHDNAILFRLRNFLVKHNKIECR